MKKLRFIGLLVTVVLLAFGLALGCSSGGSDDDDNPADLRTSTYEGTASGQKVEITFSNATIQARARAISEPPQSGDYYVIKVAGTETSRGTISVGANNVIIFNPTSPAGQAPFQGSLTNGVLAVSGVPSPTGAALSVTATVPGSAAGGVGGGGGTGTGTQPGGSGGGGSSYSETPKTTKAPEASLITYTITNNGANTGTPTTALTLNFSSAVDNLSRANIVIENGTGKAEVDDFEGPAALSYVVRLKGLSAGNVTLSIKDMPKIDPTPKTIPIFDSTAWTGLTEQTGAIVLQLPDGTTSAAAHYFLGVSNTLEITVDTALKNLTMDNIGWYPVVDNVTTPALAGFKADIEVTNLTRSDPTTFTAEVKVNKQGPVQFYLQGSAPIVVSGTPPNEVIEVKPLNPTLQTLAHAVNTSKMDYSVSRADGDAGGLRSRFTTTALKVEFEYNPAAITGGSLASAFSIASADTVGNWAAGTGTLLVTSDPTVYTLTSSTPLKASQGFIDFTISDIGITGAAKRLEVFRAPKIKYTATTVETAGITTYILLTFERPFSQDDFDNYDDAPNAFDAGEVKVKDSFGQWIANPATSLKATTAAGSGDNTTIDFAVSDTVIPRQLIRLPYPISQKNQGRGTVQLHADYVGDDIDDQPVPVQLRHAYSTFEATGSVAAGGTTLTIVLTLGESIADPFDSSLVPTIKLVKVQPSNPLMTITTPASAISVTAPVNLTGTTTTWTLDPLIEGANWLRKSSVSGAETTPVTIQIGRPSTINYGNFFFDPDREITIQVAIPEN